MRQRMLLAMAATALVAGSVGLLRAQERPAPAGVRPGGPEAPPPAPEYRVMALAELFEGDEAAKAKIAELSIQVTGGDARVRVTRTDMDAKDYERALNRWAKEGWTLVAVNRSNYWVFVKSGPGDARR